MKQFGYKLALGLAALGLALMPANMMAQKKNVILYLGDGFGLAPRTAARMALGQGQSGKRLSSDPNFHQLNLDFLKYVGMITTHSLNSWITDSAPGATCYAVGPKGKIDNEFISMDPETMQPLETILEKAKKEGYAVGLVTTTRITHASPAVFASHIWERDLEGYIAAQYVSTTEAEYEQIFTSGDSNYVASRDWQLPTPKIGVSVDVLLGGGAGFFMPQKNAGPNTVIRDHAGNAIMKDGKEVTLGSGKRTDNADLIEIAKQRGYTYVNSRDALLGVDLSQFTPDNNKKLIGLFHNSHCSYEQDRQIMRPWEPTLAEMTEIAIEVLKRKSPKGFFLFVEGGRIDHLEHGNAGGIGFTADLKNYVVTADKEAQPDERQYLGDTTVVPGIYGSDYMIKEVLAYDYAVGKGRKLLEDPSAGQTLILTTSDHECGGFGVVGLHDEGDAQKNGTKIRTYAKTPAKPAGSPFTPIPENVIRGDHDINGWFPEYEMVDFQGYKWPKAPANGRRLVIAYSSNPMTNGNGSKVGGTPGNHTPQDIIIGADDNMDGEYASRIVGRGLLDNTDLAPIMADFLNVKLATFVKGDDGKPTELVQKSAVFPNPAVGTASIDIEFQLEQTGAVTVEVYNSIGQRVRTLFNNDMGIGTQHLQWNKNDDSGAVVAPDTYYIVIKTKKGTLSEKAVVL